VGVKAKEVSQNQFSPLAQLLLPRGENGLNGEKWREIVEIRKLETIRNCGRHDDIITNYFLSFNGLGLISATSDFQNDVITPLLIRTVGTV